VTLTEEQDAAAAMVHDLTERVLDNGLVVQYVPADMASRLHQQRPFGYTIGRTLYGKPEFLVTGVPFALTHHLLTELARMDEATGQMLVGAYPRIKAEGSEVRLKLILADPGPLIGALLTFGLTKVTAIQALWPRDGGYPTVDNPWPDQPIHPHGRTPLVDRDPYRE
jgi:hypothetical protein